MKKTTISEISRVALGSRVTRKVFMDDGTWRREGDDCLSRSPLKHGVVKMRLHGGEELVVMWDDGTKQRLLPHGVDLE